MKILLTTFIMLFLICCYPTTSERAPGCLFETDICIGSSLGEINSHFSENLLKQENKAYQYVVLDQPYSRNDSSKVTLDRIIYLYLDGQENLEKFEVEFMYFGTYNDRERINYWQEFVLAMGEDQLGYYGVGNLKWERPWQYEDNIDDIEGIRIIHGFNMSDIALVTIEVSKSE